MNSLKIVSSKFKETYMLLMDYPSISEEYFSDYAKNATWGLLHAYTDAHSQIITDEHKGDGVQAILRLKPQCISTY